MAPGSNERHTGTVPKSKIRNNCKVPQEAVTPTRRDMNNTNLISSSLDWVPVSEHNSRSNYNRSQNQTASQSESDYGDLETVMSFEGNSGRFVPVRPQPRILPLSSPQNHRDITYDHNEDLNSTSSTNHLNHYSHTNMNAQHTNHGAAAVMIVNPTTPNSVCSNGTYQFNLQNASANSSRNNGPRSFNTTRNMQNGIPGQGMLNNNHATSNTHSSNMKSNNLLNNGSDNTQNSSASGSEVSQVHNESSRSIADAMVEACPDTAQVEHRLGQIREYIRVTSTLVDSMRNSEDEEHIANTQEEFYELIVMLNNLKESEMKLENMLRLCPENNEILNEEYRLKQLLLNDSETINDGIEITEIDASSDVESDAHQIRNGAYENKENLGYENQEVYFSDETQKDNVAFCEADCTNVDGPVQNIDTRSDDKPLEDVQLKADFENISCLDKNLLLQRNILSCTEKLAKKCANEVDKSNDKDGVDRNNSSIENMMRFCKLLDMLAITGSQHLFDTTQTSMLNINTCQQTFIPSTNYQEIIVRPMSVQSTGSAYSDNELWQNELKAKMEISQQRLAALQEQQTRLLKYQAEAKKQLAEISANRSRPLIGTEIRANQSSPPVLQESSSSPRMFPNTYAHHSNYNQSSSSNPNVNRTFTSNQVGVATTLPHITEYQQNMNQLYSSDEQAAVSSGANDIPIETQISGLSNLINSQLVDSEEEGDTSLNQHETLRNKLRELQMKKQHMENLVAEFQSLQANVWPQKIDKNEDKAPSSRLVNSHQEQHPNTSSDESGTDDRFHQSDGRNDVDNQKSEDTWKIMEVTAMKAKLEKLHEIMRTVDNIENRLSTSVLHDEQQPEEHNLNRQDSCKWEDDGDSNKSARLQNQITPSKLTNERTNSGNETSGINMTTLQQLTQQMRREAMSISDQRKRLRNLSNKESQLKFPDKKVNAESEARKSKGKSCLGPLEKKQMALKAELEEKKRELEALLNKQSENNTVSEMDTQDAGSVAGPSRRSSNSIQRANQHSHIKDHGESDSFISGMQMDMRSVKCSPENGSMKDNVDEDGDGRATTSHASTPEPYRQVDNSLVAGAGASLDTLLLPTSSPAPLAAPSSKNKPSAAPKRNDFESQSAATKSSQKTCPSWRNRQQSMGSIFGDNDNCGLCGQAQCIANQPASSHQPNSDGGQSRNQHMENYWWNNKSNQDHRTNQFTQNSHSQTMDHQMMLSQHMPYPPYPYNMMMPYAGMMPAASYLPPPVVLPPDAWWGRAAITQCCQQIHAQHQEIVTLRNSISLLETRYETLMNNLMSNMVGVQPTCNLPHASAKPPAPPPHESVPEAPQLCPPTQQPIFNNRMPFPIQYPNILNNQQGGPQVIQNDMNSNYPGSSQHTASPRSSPGTALNNQVPPGNRANNYWDNFRSYSRQNLLSSSNKANAEGHTSNVAMHGAHPLAERSHNSLVPPPSAPKRNTDASRDQRRRRNHQPFHANNADAHNQYQNFHSDLDWPNSSNAPRGTEMAANVFNAPVNLNVNRDSMLSERNLNVSLPPTAVVQDTNINLSSSDSTDKRKSSSKLPAKNSTSSTNYAAGYTQSRNLDLNGGSEVSNLNLASSDSEGTRDKSTSKLFDLLRENVYSEVTALISANESHPHFLIQLFRDLQQISSEPLRQRALRSIRNVSSGFNDSRIADEYMLPRNDAPLAISHNSQPGEDPEGMDSVIRSDMDSKIIEFVTAHGTEMCNVDFLDVLANVILDIANESGRPNLYSSERLRTCLAIFEGRKLCDIGNELLLNISLLPTSITPVRTIHEEEIPRLPSDGSDSSIMQEVAGALSIFSNITSSSHMNRSFSNVEYNATQSESQFLDGTRLESNNDDFNTASTSGLKSTSDIGEPVNIYNGDLAEADQTQHRDNEQTSGHENVDMTLEVATNAPIEESTPTEAEAEWLGLDRVPTRLHLEDGSGNQTD